MPTVLSVPTKFRKTSISLPQGVCINTIINAALFSAQEAFPCYSGQADIHGADSSHLCRKFFEESLFQAHRAYRQRTRFSDIEAKIKTISVSSSH